MAPFILGLILFLPGAITQQLAEPTLIVNGNPLPTSRPVTRIGNEWFLPIVAVARSLGMELRLVQGPVLHVQRLDGTETTYDGRTGEIRYRFLLLSRVRQFQQVNIERLDDDILFPVSGAVALLGLDIREDFERSAFVVQAVLSNEVARQPNEGSFFHLGGLDYSYGLSTNGTTYGQFASLRSEFLTWGIRVRSNFLLSRIPGRALLNVTQGSVRADLSSSRAIVMGDQGVYSGLEAMTASVRGLGYETRFNRFSSYAYFGKAAGASVAGLQSIGAARYDSNVAGANLRRALNRGDLSVAGVHFSAPSRRGTSVGVAYKENRGKNQISVEMLGGSFPGGAAAGLAVADAFSPSTAFTLTGRIERYGKNFLSPRDEPRFTDQLTRTVSMTVRPIRYLTFNGGFSGRNSISEARRDRSYNYAANAVAPGPYPVQFGFFRSIQLDDASLLGRFTLDQYLLTLPEFRRISVYSYFSRTLTAGETVENLNTTLNLGLGSFGRLGVHDQLQFKKTRRYGIDWTFQAAEIDRFIHVGLDRVVAINGDSSFSPVASLKLPLPGDQSLEVKYVGEKDSHLLQFQLAGSIIRNRSVVSDAAGLPAVVIAAPVVGRVFLDEDMDSSFQPAQDRPIANVAVWLNEESVTTNAEGSFRFEGIAPGAYRVRAELAGLPADLVFADISERTIAVVPYQDNNVHFRVTRAGRISGTVTYMDYTVDPENPVERPLPDVHVIATGEKDTFSETNGSFLLGDLIPGSYELKLDPTTIPARYVSVPDRIRVNVGAGQSVENVRFQLAVPPRAVIERRLPE